MAVNFLCKSLTHKLLSKQLRLWINSPAKLSGAHTAFKLIELIGMYPVAGRESGLAEDEPLRRLVPDEAARKILANLHALN